MVSHEHSYLVIMYLLMLTYVFFFFWSLSLDSMFYEGRDYVYFFFLTWHGLAPDKYLLNEWSEFYFIHLYNI